MKLRKLLAMFLTLSMLVSMVPTAAFATETGSEPSGESEVPAVVNPNNLFLDKTATLKNDGTYTINLKAYATGSTVTKTITEGVPLDVVLVMDQSGSLVSDGDRLTTLKSSVNSFLEYLRENGEKFGVNHRVAICGFASHGKQGTAGIASDGYSYANDNRDNAWTNTGIFVNGEFKDYGTVEYTKVNSYLEISTENVYSVKSRFEGQTLPETFKVVYQNYYWTTNSGGKPISIAGPYSSSQAKQGLYDTVDGEVYTVGDSVNLLTDADYAAAWESIADGENGQGSINPNITSAVEHLSSNGGTATFMGMKMARRMLENLPTEADGVARKKIVVVFTDGEPGPNGYAQGDADAALAEAARIKDGATEIYTIGIYGAESAETVETFMNQLSSNYESHSFETTGTELIVDMLRISDSFGYSDREDMYYQRNIDNSVSGISPYFYKTESGDYWPFFVYRTSSGYSVGCLTDDGEMEVSNLVGYRLAQHVPNSDPDENYYLHAADISDLSGIFETISSDMTGFTSELSLDASAVLKDVLAEGFTLTDNTTITVSVVPGSMSGEAITWGEAQQVLTFAYPAATTGSGKVVVNGAADQSEMTLTAKVTDDGIVTVTGFNYAKAEDADQINAQYITEGHPGSKLLVSITGVEADKNIATDSITVTNKGTSGIYEGPESDADGDGEKGEMQASFPIPTTYLTSKTYYLDYTGKMTFNPADFLMTVEGVNADIDGYNFFDPAAPGTTVYTEYGKITVNADGTITYELVGSDWEHNDVFYLFGTTEDPTVKGATANANGNMWSKITIVPPVDIRGKLYVDKSATLEDNGTYTIDLEAYATGTPIITSITEGIPLDVVLVVDQSGSLHANGGTYDGVPLKYLKESVTEFVETLKANGEAYGVNHRISVCGFGSGELQGPSGSTKGGYSFAGDNWDTTWVNTGLFVNGEFRDYATMNYIRITDPDEIDVNKYYTVKLPPNENGISEYVRAFYYAGYGAWRYNAGPIGEMIVDGTTVEDNNYRLVNEFEVYKCGKSTVQLHDVDYAASWENLASGENGQGSINPDILKTIDKLAANGATNTFYGLKMASRMLENAPDDGIQRKKVVIVFTDGEPGYGGIVKGDADAALSDVMKIKETGAEVYAVGVYSAASEAKVNTFMNHLSSNYKSHSFTTTPTRIDMSQAKTGTTGNTRLATNIESGKNGISPYFVKVGDDYCPVVISTNYENPGGTHETER